MWFGVQRFPAVTAAAADGSPPPAPSPACVKKQLGKGRALETGNENAAEERAPPTPPPPTPVQRAHECFFVGAAGDQLLGARGEMQVIGLCLFLALSVYYFHG